MKKIVLSFVCVFIACMTSHAQGVKFESGTWDEILAKAKAGNKTIFVDVYTKWCGPCKHVSETVFPQGRVGNRLHRKTAISITSLISKWNAESPAG